MNRIFGVALVATATLAAATIASSTGGPNAKLANEDRVYGGGTFGPGCAMPGAQCIGNTRSFSVDAHATSNDQAAYGDIWYGAPRGQDQHAQITCLAVHGTKAVVAGIIDQATRPSIVGWWAVFFFDAHGTPARGARDRASLGYLGPPSQTQQPAGFPYVCPSPDTGAPYTSAPPGYLPIKGGDIAVNDSNQLPVSDSTQVVVPRGQSLQVAFAEDLTGFGSSLEPGIANAVRMAVDAHPTVHDFPIQVNAVNAPCGDATGDVAAADSIAANIQNVGVLGQFCSTGFDQALPVYEGAGLVTITGSATNDALPSFATTVFDRTAVADAGGFASWYAAVSQLPSDLAWRQAYTLRFGTAPTDFADLYFDAAGLLLRNLESVSTVDGGSLVVNRAALAQAVRGTTSYEGVTCTITLDPATGNRLNDPNALSRCAH